MANIDFIWKNQLNEKSGQLSMICIKMNIMFVKVDPNQKGPKAAKIFHFYKHENHLMKMEYRFSKVILIND